MNKTTRVKRRTVGTFAVLLLGLTASMSHAAPSAPKGTFETTQPSAERLSVRHRAIVPIAAFAATGDLARLRKALEQGLDAGLTVSETKEVLVQVYAYAGFPRSLNALGEMMKVLEWRKGAWHQRSPRPCPKQANPQGRGAANRRYSQPDQTGRFAGEWGLV